jgi:hypothetical protein
MKKRKLLTWSEGQVDKILRRRLPNTRYRVLVAIRLSDAVGPERGETLPDAEFQFLSRAHLDFLIVTNTQPADPVFAVEFDGPHHDDPRQRARDVMKNRLCKKAGLPLLRIRAPEIEVWEQITVLDYIIYKFVAWERESETIIGEIEEYAASLDPRHRDRLVSDWDPSLDPTFEFHLRHPFLATPRVKARLLHQYYIASAKAPSKFRHKARWLCRVMPHSEKSADEQFYTCSMKAVVTPIGSEETILFSTIRAASIRSWLPIDMDVPSTNKLSEIFDCRPAEALALWKRRIEGMWLPSIPGVSTWDIAENFAEYLAFRAVEIWAQERGTDRV